MILTAVPTACEPQGWAPAAAARLAPDRSPGAPGGLVSYRGPRQPDAGP